MSRRNEIVGLKELMRDIKRLEQLPQKIATKAAKAGATIALKAARRNAPVLTGDLKRGIILHGEKRIKIGKKMYDIMMDPSKNDVFAEVSADGKRSYYPASMEYGYFTKNGHYIPGDRYFRKSIDENDSAIEAKIVEVAASGVDKILRGS